MNEERLCEEFWFDVRYAKKRHKVVTPDMVRRILEKHLYKIEANINIQIVWGFHWLFAEIEGDIGEYFMGFDGRLGCNRLFEVNKYMDIARMEKEGYIPLVLDELDNHNNEAGDEKCRT